MLPVVIVSPMLRARKEGKNEKGKKTRKKGEKEEKKTNIISG